MILNDTILTEDGPYLDFAFMQFPLIDPESLWPASHLYAEYVFFRMSDSLLGVFCDCSGEYAPFDPYDLTNLSSPEERQQFLSVLLRWIDSITALSNADIEDKCGSLFENRLPELTGSDMKMSLIETLLFIISYVRKAQQTNYTVAIVGI